MAADLNGRASGEGTWPEGEALFRAMAETTSDAIIVIDSGGAMLFVNAAAEAVFGYTVAEMTGAPPTMLMPDYLHHVHEAALKRSAETGQKQTARAGVELSGFHRSGRAIPLEVSFSEFIQDGRRFFTGIVRDITERKQAEERLRESEERFRMFSETSSEGIFIHAQGTVIEANRTAALMCGYDPSELIGMPLFEFADPASHEIIRSNAVPNKADGPTTF